MKTAIQLFTLREIDTPLPKVLELVGETPLDGVELVGAPDDEEIDDVERTLDRASLEVAGIHAQADDIEDDVERHVEACRRLDCDRLVVPYLDDSHFESAAAVDRTAERLSALADRLADDGVRLAYHNHDHEFVRVGDDHALGALFEATDERVTFEVDVGWAGAAGVDPTELLDRFAGRCPLVHVKDVDYETGEPVELGEGDLDAEAAVAAAVDAGAEWFVYEHDEPSDPEASLRRGSEALDDLLAAHRGG